MAVKTWYEEGRVSNCSCKGGCVKMDSYINYLNDMLDKILSIGRSIDDLDEYEFDRFELIRLLLIKYLRFEGLSYDLDPETYRPINIEDKREHYSNF